MQHLISSAGYAAVFLLMVAESACIPLPSELTMPFAGALAASGRLDLVVAIVLGVLGNVVGAYIAWAVGRAGGRALVLRFGRVVRLSEHDLDRADRWFERRGEATVLISRILPVVRTFISLPAGIADMAPVRFGIYTLVGSIPWVTGLAVAGYELGRRWRHIYDGFSTATVVVAVVIVVAIVVALFLYLRGRWTSRTSTPTATDPPAEP
ncbi:MAG: DedA family protein [Acidimicrobiales bacterium]|nr:DedA family protein [Acidimicrobiales bacterium]